MPVSSSVVSVTTSAAALPVTDNDKRAGMSVVIQVPTGGNTVYAGGPGVTTSNGYPIAAGQSVAFDLNTAAPGYTDASDVLWLVAGSTQNVYVLATGV